jgi:hypothetical protein
VYVYTKEIFRTKRTPPVDKIDDLIRRALLAAEEINSQLWFCCRKLADLVDGAHLLVPGGLIVR